MKICAFFFRAFWVPHQLFTGMQNVLNARFRITDSRR